MNTCADPEIFPEGGGSDGYLRLPGGGVGGSDAYFWWFFIANLKKFEFCIGGRGSGPPDTPLDPCMEQFRMKIARNNGVD